MIPAELLANHRIDKTCFVQVVGRTSAKVGFADEMFVSLRGLNDQGQFTTAPYSVPLTTFVLDYEITKVAPGWWVAQRKADA